MTHDQLPRSRSTSTLLVARWNCSLDREPLSFLYVHVCPFIGRYSTRPTSCTTWKSKLKILEIVFNILEMLRDLSER